MSSVFSRSQSSKISTGAWPPSSIVTRVMLSAHRRMRCLPTLVEPVKLTLRMTRLADHAAELTRWADEGAAIVALGVLGIPVEQLGGGESLGLGLGEGLALLLGQCRGDMVGPLAQQRRRFVQDRAALLHVHRAPF